VKPLYVIAGNYDEYYKWITQRDLHHQDWRYISRAQDIRGIENPGGIFIGTWYERPDAYDIIAQLRICSRQRNPAIEKALVVLTEYSIKKAVV
jgi:hypothetical protein